jgi:hypothetical protein
MLVGLVGEVQMFRCSGVQVFRCSGVQVFRCSGVQVFRCSGEGHEAEEIRDAE